MVTGRPEFSFVPVSRVGGSIRYTDSSPRQFRKTSLKDPHFHDLRGTAVTRLALSNYSVPEIAAITGHSMKTVQETLDAHYLGGRLGIAESAIKKLNEVCG